MTDIQISSRDKLSRNRFGDVKIKTGSDHNVFQQFTSGGAINGKAGGDALQVYLSKPAATWSSIGGEAIAQQDNIYVFSFLGGHQSYTYIPAIETGTQGILATTYNNYQQNTYVRLDIGPDLTMNGYFNIPCYAGNITYELSEETGEYAYDLTSTQYRDLRFEYSLLDIPQSAYFLEVDNNTPVFTCDSYGYIDHTSQMPSVTAQLKKEGETVGGTIYTISYDGRQNVHGLGINAISGQVQIDSNTVSFDGQLLQTDIKALYGDAEYNKKVTFLKSIPGKDGQSGQPGQPGQPGQDGEDATSYWITTTADSVNVDSNNGYIPTPNVIEAQGYWQKGTTIDTWDAEMKMWLTERATGQQTTAETATEINITPQLAYTYASVTFAFPETGVTLATKTVPFILTGKNGEDGGKGDTGLTGPSVRGPKTFVEGETGIRWCNGEGPLDSDKQWIDIVLEEYEPEDECEEDEQELDHRFWRCSTSFTQTATTSWDYAKTHYFTEADATFDFVATNLLLAKNAKINFLSGNELHILDVDDQLIAGVASGAYSFWAGYDTPADAPFRVTKDGEVTCTDIAVQGGTINIQDHGVANFYVDNTGHMTARDAYFYDGSIAIGGTTGNKTFSVDSNGNLIAKSGTFYGFIRQPFNVFYATNYNAHFLTSNESYLILAYQNGVSFQDRAAWCILPRPTSELSGHTYHIIIPPQKRMLSADDQVAGLHIRSYDNDAIIYNYMMDYSGVNTAYKSISVGPGYLEIVCTGTTWIITQSPMHFIGTTDDGDQTTNSILSDNISSIRLVGSELYIE